MSNIDVYNSDCLCIIKDLPDCSIDLIVTDPPYRTTSRGTAGNSGGMMQKDLTSQGKIFEYNDIQPCEYAGEFFRLLKDGSHCYVMTNHLNLIEMLNSFTAAGFHFIKSLIWKKDNKIMGSFYMSQFEYILFFRKGKGVKINNCGTSDVLEIPNKKHSDFSSGENLHDTEKPVDLMKILVKNSSNPGDVVLDPFMGVGSTGVACKITDRSFIGVEIDPHYFDIAKDRIDKTDKIDSVEVSPQIKFF